MFNIQTARKGRRINLVKGLVSYWTMQEASGARADSLGANNLTDVNGVGSAAGIIGNAASFVTASSQSLTHVNNSDFQVGDSDFTFAGWIYMTNVGINNTLVSKWTSALQGYYCAYQPLTPGFVFAIDNGTTANAATFSGTATANTWYFIVASYDSTNDLIQISINNSVTQVTSQAGGVRIAATDFWIGGISGFSNYYTSGRIDEIGYWHRLLTAQERTYLYNAGAARTYPLPG